jgi:hypothetical protein
MKDDSKGAEDVPPLPVPASGVGNAVAEWALGQLIRGLPVTVLTPAILLSTRLDIGSTPETSSFYSRYV